MFSLVFLPAISKSPSFLHGPEQILRIPEWKGGGVVVGSCREQLGVWTYVVLTLGLSGDSQTLRLDRQTDHRAPSYPNLSNGS